MRRYLLLMLMASLPLSTGLLPVECTAPAEPPTEPSSTTFTRNLDNFLNELSKTPVFQRIFNGIYPDMKFLYNVLRFYYDPNSAGPTNVLPVLAQTDLYDFVVGMKLHCFENAFDLAKTLLQIDEVRIERPVSPPESASTTDSNPTWLEEDNGTNIEQFQYINDEIAADFLND
ncbi:hypothetical protein ABW20_dc0104617 [Dactylellina cionopaga]|nr:hypothetical protein ABW20_dc0104617 [Dactylellina cionopaga]